MHKFIVRSPLPLAWGVVTAWVLAYALLKAFSPAGLDIDGAEQVYFAQSWQIGYGTRQPPLYTWLLLALKPAAASWSATLEVARYACLLLWLAGVQAFAKACQADGRTQARVLLAHLGVMLAMWRVHDSLTHTVLAAAITLWGSVALVKALTRPPYWILVGLMAGLACLSKLNAALWCASSFVAAWWVIWSHAGKASVQTLRPVGAGVVHPFSDGPFPTLGQHGAWMLLGMLAFAAMMVPYASWWFTRPSGSVALARRIIVADEALPIWRPPLEVLLGTLEYLLITPLLLALVAWYVERGRSRGGASPLGGQWQWLQAVAGLALLALMITAMKGSHFTPRWLWPVVPGVTVWMSVWALRVIDARGDSRSRRASSILIGVFAVLAVGMAALRVWEPLQNAQRCRNCWTDRDAQAISAQLHLRHGAEPLRIITGDDHLAGILAQLDDGDLTWTSISPDLPPPRAFASSHAACVAAWMGVDTPNPPPAPLGELIGAQRLPLAQRSDLPLRLAPQRRFWLQSLRLPDEVCARVATP